jgi:lysyl-tRNA synthetase class 2
MPGADLAALQARARMLAAIRGHFAAAGVMEVETPLLAQAGGTDPALEPLRTRYTGPGAAAGRTLFLQTSPEFAMKRLLAAGSGAIYQVCKAFRDGEAGPLHNPEFSLLEWYRPGWDASALIDEVAQVARLALERPDLPIERWPYAEVFREATGLDPLRAGVGDLAECAAGYGLHPDLSGLDRDAWLDLLWSHRVQPGLGPDALCFVTDYPASQAALARLNPDGLSAARFELFHRGIELANGFHELTDAAEQGARFEADNCRRRALGLPPIPIDRRLLQAMEEGGLPDCAGVAVGLDRLLMLRLGRDSLDQVLAFSLARC